MNDGSLSPTIFDTGRKDRRGYPVYRVTRHVHSWTRYIPRRGHTVTYDCSCGLRRIGKVGIGGGAPDADSLPDAPAQAGLANAIIDASTINWRALTGG